METIYTDIRDFQKYGNVNASFALRNLEPQLSTALRNHIAPFFTIDFYNEVMSIDTPNVEQTQLQSFFKEIIAKFTLAEYIKTGGVVISNNAISREESQHSKTAYKYQVTENIRLYKIQGWDAIEATINYLDDLFIKYPEQNKDGDAITYADGSFQSLLIQHKKSANSKSLRARFINTAFEFNQQYRIVEGRRTFNRLVPIIDDVELGYRIAFGEDFYQELKTAIATRTIHPNQLALFIFLKKAIAFMVIEKAVEQSLGVISADGFRFSEDTGNDGHSQNRIQTNTKGTRLNALSEGKKWNTQLMKFLNKNISNFPTYAAHLKAQKADITTNLDTASEDFNPKLVRF